MKPAIGQQKHDDAVQKYRNKLKALEKLIADGDLDKFPARSKIATFSSWVDAELGVEKLSRSIFYQNTDEYVLLRRQLDHLLQQVARARTKVSKRSNAEAELRRKLSIAEERAQSYVNQYTIAMCDLTEARKEIERLNERLRRATAKTSRVLALHSIKDPNPNLERD